MLAANLFLPNELNKVRWW